MPQFEKSQQILVVDDDPITRLVISDALGDGFDVQEAASGEEALERFADLSPDLVLLDVVMLVFSTRPTR